MSDGLLPQRKMPKLIVAAAFDRGEDGELFPAYGPAEQQMYIQSLSNVVTLKQYSDRLGSFRYGITEHEKVTLMTFPLGDGILCVSASPRANSAKIRDKVMALLKKGKGAKKI